MSNRREKQIEHFYCGIVIKLCVLKHCPPTKVFSNKWVAYKYSFSNIGLDTFQLTTLYPGF